MNIDTLTREKFPVKSEDILEISVPPDQDAAEKRFARIVNSAQVYRYFGLGVAEIAREHLVCDVTPHGATWKCEHVRKILGEIW